MFFVVFSLWQVPLSDRAMKHRTQFRDLLFKIFTLFLTFIYGGYGIIEIGRPRDRCRRNDAALCKIYYGIKKKYL